MENLKKYKAQLKEIEVLVDKLEEGSLDISELLKLEELTRAVHERSIILKYKMFEGDLDQVKPEEENIEETPAFEEEEEIEEMDFSMFNASAENEDVKEASDAEVDEQDAETESVEEDPLEVVGESEEQEVQQGTNEDLEFWQKINIEDDSLSSKFAESKLDSLVGAFSLNEKLRYINDLFDGSSELFSDAVKALDKLNDLDAAHTRFGEFAHEHNWDPEDEAVVEFMSFVRRRYA